MTVAAERDNFEDRGARFSARVVVMETVTATTVGFVLRSVPAELRDKIIAELRANSTVQPYRFSRSRRR
ncbi:hypothetical protein FJN17_01050 [Bradyrhizobium symbiodeficiens]|uniref:Uncharacterized protein n=1 Tax=Bradyrhizobium symbiodeficiens TaxID=1404367 RepID=A0ABX5VZ47_9BRAD|nr:hypothetical protein [Bradyrhizobium symbiodeficiens]QDF36259.1 hypothetical protein FJN17_01050 [Bradyrhizobium symbiodeficiens]